ncbi:glycosyl transferase family 1 [Knoellia sinensis KCTC 19936]|uniref:Glycosyl transferase family 1 n=1 Tax=Knoellia sinensis KCTC 19936 TaxID=1385520 RepID=A0A0A0J7Z5_9MICO|nr:glycosyltransferase family 4 protein [Knoellia sinensis]KGN32884.1 glycosyl transferase family 1 [Knoellia sinensis KCTC 19936]
MRVALLSDCYLPRLGGIEVQVHDLAHHLVMAGHDVEVITATAGETREHTTETEQVVAPGSDGSQNGTVTVHRLPLPIPGAPPINPFVKDEVRELLTRTPFDVAHGHMGVVSPFATDMIGVALEAGLPTAATWHCVIDRSAPVFRALGHARRWGEAGAALSAVSTMAAERVALITGDDSARATVKVLNNGIDVAQWRPSISPSPSPRADTVAPADDGVVRIVSAMRFVQRKRPGALVDVLRAAREQLDASAPGTMLEAHLVGDGPQRRLIAAQLERHGIDWIHLPGRVTREHLRELHWRSDIYVTTARLEAFGIAALEARTAGLVVAARAGTGVEDFVTDGRNGILRSSDDDLATGLAQLASRPDELARLRAHNVGSPPAQSWDRVVETTLAEYARAQRGAS